MNILFFPTALGYDPATMKPILIVVLLLCAAFPLAAQLPTPNTDGGWVYATITAAGQLTAAGKVKSCIGCHQEAPNDRLFGVPKSVAF